MMRILIVKTSSLGDIIHAFPVLDYLHEHYPEAIIDWVVEAPFASLIETHPYVAHVYQIETKAWRKGVEFFKGPFNFIRQIRKVKYDWLFDFQGNTKSAFITALAKARKKVGFGWHSVSEWPNLLTTHIKRNPDPAINVRQENLTIVKDLFEKGEFFENESIFLRISESETRLMASILSHPIFQKGKKILVCPGSTWPNKQMTVVALTRFLNKVSRLCSCSFLLVWGNEAERRYVEEIQNSFSESALIMDKLSLSLLQNLMQKVDLVIAMDSLPLHLAGTTNTPVFGIFGASSANKYMPQGKDKGYFQGTCPYGKTFYRRCPLLRSCSTGSCIRELDEDALFACFTKFYCKED